MKELLDKFFGLFSEGLDKLEENKTEEAIKKLKEASELSVDLSKKSEEKQEVDLEKFFESKKGEEILKKYAEIRITAEDAKDLKNQIATLNSNITEMQKSIDSLKEEKETDDKTITKTFENLIDRVEVIEKTSISKIED